MASLFRARRQAAEDGGSGGKIVRGRRTLPPASPYAHPPPSPAPTGSPRWFLHLVSGTRKIISSVFRSDGSGANSSASSSSDNSSNEDSRSRSEEQEGVDTARELHGCGQGLKKIELINERVEGSHAIVSRSENILTIEKLFKQETFSREECNKLIRLIQSRVVESPSGFVKDGTGREITDKGVNSSAGFLGDCLSLKHNPELPESIQYSTSNQWSFSPRTPAFRACIHDNNSTAVMEAKKWLEEKKQSSDFKVYPVCGPCTLSNDILHHGTHDKVVSPVDLAKSYMRSLPPWQSPYFGSGGLMPVPTRLDFGMDGSKYATTSHSLPPFKDFKRKYLSSISRESPVNSRNVRQKLVEDILESRKLSEIALLGKLSENETSKSSSAVNEISQNVLEAKYDSCSLQATEISNSHAKLYGLLVDDQCSKGTLKSPDGKTVGASPRTLTDKCTSIILTSEPKETVHGVKSGEESALLSSSLLDPAHSKIKSETTKKTVEVLGSANESTLLTISSSDPTHSTGGSEPMLDLAFNEHVDLMNPSPMEQEDNVDCNLPCAPFISDSTPVEHAGDYISEKVVALPEGNKCSTLSDVDDVTSLGNNVQASNANIDAGDITNLDNGFQTDATPVIVGIPEVNSSAEVYVEPDATLEDVNVYTRDEISGLAKEVITNGDGHDVTNLPSDAQTSNANIDADDITNLENDFHTPAVGIPEINSSVELNLDPDAKTEDGNAYSHDEAYGLTNEVSTNSGSPPSNANSQSLCGEEKSDIHIASSEQTAATSAEFFGLPSENVLDAMDVVHGTDSSTSRFESGMGMKSVEQVLIELQPGADSPKRRAVPKRRRGRGRGRGQGRGRGRGDNQQ